MRELGHIGQDVPLGNPPLGGFQAIHEGVHGVLAHRGRGLLEKGDENAHLFFCVILGQAAIGKRIRGSQLREIAVPEMQGGILDPLLGFRDEGGNLHLRERTGGRYRGRLGPFGAARERQQQRGGTDDA